ncbi:unnamed protein product [Dibothriocephalus latus]|uniref:Tc1-like transposase DDE domain-containing protein n=1 Tax=Dibothriocephalus latus TaxID=60516 RepID=A0A3P6QQX4_DIBLA|nr:unnamed protein product [Dibothriocephalus latus]
MWPANSSDLNPIENQWPILGNMDDQKVPAPNTVAGLEKSLLEAWRKTSLETLQNLTHSMPIREEALLKVKGQFPVKCECY